MVWKSTQILGIVFTDLEHHVEPMCNVSKIQVWPLAGWLHDMLVQFWATLKPRNFQNRANFWILVLWWKYSTPLGCWFRFFFAQRPNADHMLRIPLPSAFFLSCRTVAISFCQFLQWTTWAITSDVVWPMLALCWAPSWPYYSKFCWACVGFKLSQCWAN